MCWQNFKLHLIIFAKHLSVQIKYCQSSFSLLQGSGLAVFVMIMAVLGVSVMPALPSYAQTDDSEDQQGMYSGLVLGDPEFVNSFGVPVGSLSAGSMVQVSADIDNMSDGYRDFVYHLRVMDSDGNTIKVQWMAGMISAEGTVNSSISWIPKEAGSYTIVVSAGNDLGSLDNQKMVDVTVGSPTLLQSCDDRLELVFKVSDGSPVCVKPATAEKLVERGWARTA